LVEQAIGNVVANAVVHTPPQTRVVVDAVVTDDNVDLRIADDGPGISAETLPHIFDKFVKGSASGGVPVASRADGSQGTGLGLAIAKGILDAHGGAISVESESRGARFTMSFPRGSAPA
jgi:two-component system sensor histidine kinase KdpD